ncbi:response regulator [Chitinibacter tainanensis]|uniref:response regulator n=1 Tax=Chitinibacter tainanensis TaxID=230667 RepID=UPI00041AF7A4|nr:response regulator [Chitinibacter tainanensis]
MSVSPAKKVLIVDDDAIQRVLLSNLLNPHYQVFAAPDGRAGLALANAELPAAVISDVCMPELGGYELCQQLSSSAATAHIPVLLISAEENMTELLRVYDAGGQGFITKPIHPGELLTQLAHILQLAEQRAALEQQLNYATSAAFTAMSSMSETGTLMQAVTGLPGKHNEQEVLSHLLAMLAEFGLSGVVAIHTAHSQLCQNQAGEASPVEKAILQQMRSMERIMQFKQRLSIHFPNVSLLVTNLPINEPDRAGRLRDHLAIMLEAAQCKLDAFSMKMDVEEQGKLIATARELVQTLYQIQQQQRCSSEEKVAVISHSLMELEHSLTSFGLTDQQEENLLRIVRESWDNLSNLYQQERTLQEKLSGLADKLNQIL